MVEDTIDLIPMPGTALAPTPRAPLARAALRADTPASSHVFADYQQPPPPATPRAPAARAPLARAALRADPAASSHVFADYQQRRTPETLRRQRADLARF